MQIVLDPKNIHHAYVIEGDRELVRPALLISIEQTLGIPLQGNPDFWHGKFESFSIDHARELRERQANKAFSDSEKIFIVDTDSISGEAQNALLKVLEEPTAHTHIFIIISSRDLLLPTVRSRVVIISTEKSVGNASEHKEIKDFLAVSPAERLKMVEPLIKEKDRTGAQKFVDELIRTLGTDKKDVANNTKLIEELFTLRSFLNDRAPSIKLILEHLALITPRI